MKYVTKLGTFELNDNEILEFPRGLPGFEHLRKFSVISLRETYPICWLVSLQDETVALPVVDPWIIVENYEVELSDEDVAQLNTSDPSELMVWVVLTIPPGNPFGATANLRAPIVVNSKTGIGLQVIMEKYDLRYPLGHARTSEGASAQVEQVPRTENG